MAKSEGAGPIGQALYETAAILALGSRGTRPGMTKTMDNAFDASRDAILKNAEGSAIANPKRQLMNIAPLENKLSALRTEVENSASPYKYDSLHIIDEFEKGLENSKGSYSKTISDESKIYGTKPIKAELPTNQLPAQDILQLKRNTNQWSLLNRIPAYEKQPYLPKESRAVVDRINGALKESLDDFGKHNPEFKANFDLAEDIYKGLNDMGDATRALQSNTFAKALEHFNTKGIWGLPHIAGALAVKPIKEMALLGTILKTPVGQKAYVKAFRAAADNNVREFTHNAAIIEKIANNAQRAKQKKTQNIDKIIQGIL